MRGASLHIPVLAILESRHSTTCIVLTIQLVTVNTLNVRLLKMPSVPSVQRKKSQGCF